MRKADITRLFWFTLVCVVAVFISIPLLKSGLIQTDDGNWMVIRLSAFYQSLREGQFPVRFLGRLNYSYGYPVANFLYPGFLYLGSLLHVAGMPFQTATEFLTLGFVFIGAIFTYLWLRTFFTVPASAIGVMSFLLNPYVLFDMYTRGSLGEIVAMGTASVVLYSIETKREWLLTPSVAFLLISHNTLALFFIPVLFLYMVLKYEKRLYIPFLTGIGISAFFWIPALAEKNLVLFNSVLVSNPSHYFPVSNRLIVQSLPFLLLGCVSFIMTKKGIRREHWFVFIVSAVVIFISSALSREIWSIRSMAQLIQFPYRFLSLLVIFGPWFIAYVVHMSHRTIGYVLALTGIGVLLYYAVPYLALQSIDRPDGFYTTNEATTTVANEYMPVWIQTFPTNRASQRVEVFSGNAQIEDTRISTEKYAVNIQAHEESVLQINTIYYPGWGAQLDDGTVEISHDNPLGVMRVTIPAGKHRLFMAFRETKLRFVADCISLIFLVTWIMRIFVSFGLGRRRT